MRMVCLFIGLFLPVHSQMEAQQKKIYIAPDSHTDFMWTADEAQYKDAFLEMLDYYIDLNESTSDAPYAYQRKWIIFQAS